MIMVEALHIAKRTEGIILVSARRTVDGRCNIECRVGSWMDNPPNYVPLVADGKTWKECLKNFRLYVRLEKRRQRS